MKKKILFLLALFSSSVLCAQQSQQLGKEDVLAAFKKYNPVALEKAAVNSAYHELLFKLVSAYSAPRTQENENELIALVKNFDNSLALQAVNLNYEKNRQLQLSTGMDLQALDQKSYGYLLQIVQNIFDNTIDIKKIQIQRYKEEIKEIKKDKTLSSVQKKEQIKEIKNKISAVKLSIKQLKQNSKQKIQDTASVYWAEIRTDYEKKALISQKKASFSSEQADNLSVKSNNKKPVAK